MSMKRRRRRAVVPSRHQRLLTTPIKGKETSVATQDKNNGKRTASRTHRQSEPNSPARRAFIVLAGTSAGATLLGGLSACGGFDQRAGRRLRPDHVTPVAQDPIWGTSGAATQIIASLQSITQSMFPARDYLVTAVWRAALRRGRRDQSVHRRRHRSRAPARTRPTPPARSIRGRRFSPRSRPATRRAAAAWSCRPARGTAPGRSSCSAT